MLQTMVRSPSASRPFVLVWYLTPVRGRTLHRPDPPLPPSAQPPEPEQLTLAAWTMMRVFKGVTHWGLSAAIEPGAGMDRTNGDSAPRLKRSGDQLVSRNPFSYDPLRPNPFPVFLAGLKLVSIKRFRFLEWCNLFQWQTATASLPYLFVFRYFSCDAVPLLCSCAFVLDLGVGDCTVCSSFWSAWAGPCTFGPVWSLGAHTVVAEWFGFPGGLRGWLSCNLEGWWLAHRSVVNTVRSRQPVSAQGE